MPMSHRIDPDRRRVIVTGTGNVTIEDFLDVFARMLADPAFSPSLTSLIDLRELRRGPHSFDFERLAQTVAAGLGTRYGRRAIVAGSDLAYGIARTFSILAEFSGIEYAVFRTIKEAEAWLDAATPQEPGVG